MNRGRIAHFVLRTLFFFTLVCLFSLTHPLIAQGGGGELPFPPPEPPAIPLLNIAAAPLTVNTFPAPTTPLTVTLTNQGTGPATNITIQLDSGLLTLPISQTVGTLEAGQSLTTTLPLAFIGYEVGQHSLLLTSDAISLTNPVQTMAQLTLLEPVSNPGNLTNLEQNQGETGEAKGDDQGLPQLHLLQAQQPPTADYRGRVLTFRLVNSKGYDKDLTVTLSQWLPGLELSPATLQLSYLPTSLGTQNSELETQDSKLISFTYDSGRTTLTFTPQGDGQYALSINGGSLGDSMGGEAPEEPKGWVPTFNAPTTSLFTGSAAYQYPLLTPPGPGLFQPTLALSYSGAAGNGFSSTSQNDVAGFGWNLAGDIEVSQGVTLCPWNGHATCPANAYWYEEDPENGYALPGLIELTLSLGGTGYELTHINGESQNGYAGRYLLKGNTSLYVEYCRYSTGSTVCMNADTGDGTSDGAATATYTKGYWVIKDSQNTLYRLGYATHSEQELINGISSGGHMGPWSGANAPGHALRWRADQVKDRFGNQTTFTYVEYLPSQVNPTWSDNQVHARSSYLSALTYGYNQIVFTYGGRGDNMGIPPYDWYFHPDVVSWQTHLLTRIDINAKDYETGSGTYNPVRAYQFNYLLERHGNANDPNIGISNQTAWCKAQDTSYWGWQLALLTSITELDANNQAKVRLNNVNQPDVEFVYWWYKTAQWNNYGITNRYCAPYLLELHTPYNPTSAVATFTYSEAPHHYHDTNGPDWTTTYINTITSQTLNSGWTTDAPFQVTQFTYTNPHHGGKAKTDQWQEYTGAFQGFQDVTRTLLSGGVAHSLEVNHFLAYNFNAEGVNNNSALTGMMEWQELRTPWSQVMARTEESWTTQSADIPGTTETTRLPIRNYTIQYSTYYGAGSSYNVGNRTDTTYDSYGNPLQVREFGSNVAGTGTPYRTQQTEYLHNTSPTTWLIGLPWQVTTWAGEVTTGTIVSQQRTRYDNAGCANPGSQIPTNGLPTATDVYIPGGGSGHCDLNYLTTLMSYGLFGNAWWQLSQIGKPTGVTTFPNVGYTSERIYWRNHSTLEKMVTYSLGETLFGFNDSHTPWLFTDKTGMNGAMSRYEYDNFGRLIKQYTPNASTGQATVLSQQLVYSDTAPINNNVPLYIDTLTVPGQGYSATSRTFYDALGRARQQRSWNLASDFDKIVTDTEYNDLGQAVCQTTPIATTWATFNAILDCTGYDHTTTNYTRLGSPAISTGIDGLTSYGLALGRNSIGVDPLGRLSISVQDAYGRLSAVTEIEVTEDSFATGTFNSGNWWLSSSYAYVTTLNEQSVLRVGKAGAGGSTNAATVNQTLGVGSSFFFRFQLSDNNHDSRIMAKATDGSGAYLSLELRNGQIYPGYNSSAGSGTVTAIQIAQSSNAWYRAHISINSQGVPSWRVWREDWARRPRQTVCLDANRPERDQCVGGQNLAIHPGSRHKWGGYGLLLPGRFPAGAL